MDKLAQFYLQEIFQIHGLPKQLDQSKTHDFNLDVRDIYLEQDTKIQSSTTAHLQTNGQPERTIQILKDMLRGMCIGFQRQLREICTIVEFAPNNSTNQLLVCRHLKLYMVGNIDPQFVDRVGNKIKTIKKR